MYAERKTMTDLVHALRDLTAIVKSFKESEGGLSVYVRDGAYKDEERRRFWNERADARRELRAQSEALSTGSGEGGLSGNTGATAEDGGPQV